LTAPAQAQVGEAVTLDASASSDPDGDPLSYTWDFGDGTPPSKTTFARTTHSYARIGNYTARITVDDGKGGSCSASAPITVIQRFVLTEKGRKVLFDFNKATLKPEARSQLAGVLQTVKEQPGAQTLIVGHTDGIGSDAYNMGLSQRRAESVANYLVQNGVPRQSIRTEWHGKRQPIASNATAEGRAQNRRVEITLSPGSEHPPHGENLLPCGQAVDAAGVLPYLCSPNLPGAGSALLLVL
jgi:outer membrane protein OmpA-like peptidoglycan-associated protein